MSVQDLSPSVSPSPSLVSIDHSPSPSDAQNSTSNATPSSASTISPSPSESHNSTSNATPSPSPVASFIDDAPSPSSDIIIDTSPSLASTTVPPMIAPGSSQSQDNFMLQDHPVFPIIALVVFGICMLVIVVFRKELKKMTFRRDAYHTIHERSPLGPGSSYPVELPASTDEDDTHTVPAKSIEMPEKQPDEDMNIDELI